MALQILRSIYINSVVKLTPEVGNFGVAGKALEHIPDGGEIFQAVQSANFSLNIPRADVNAFGYDGVLDRPQLEAESATMEVSWIAQAFDSGLRNVDITGDMLQDLIDESKAQIPSYVIVRAEGVGEIKQALMGSLSGEASVGALATMTSSFTGATSNVYNLQAVTGVVSAPDGTDVYIPPEADDQDPPLISLDAAQDVGAGAANIAASPGSNFGFGGGRLVNPQDVKLFFERALGDGTVLSDFDTTNPAGATAGPNVLHKAPLSGVPTKPVVDEGLEQTAAAIAAGAVEEAFDADKVNESCAQSASFSWDMPVELILCLGANPATDGLALGNPPGSSSITVEALSAQLTEAYATGDYSMIIGNYFFALTGASIDSRTHNLAIGDLYGTYNYVLGSTGDSFEIANTRP